MKARFHPTLAVAVLATLLVGCSESPDTSNPSDISGPSFNQGAPLTGGGTGVITSLTILSSRTAGKNVHQTRRLEGAVVGGLNGTFVEEVQGVIHTNTSTVTFQGTLEFTGSVAGCPDVTGFTARITGQGVAGVPVTDGRWTVTSSTGGWLSGTGTIHQEGPLLTYEGRYLCR